MTLHRDRMFQTVRTLDTFVNRCLNLQPKGPFLSGFEYNRDLLKAAMANTYPETVGSRADSIHLAIKNVPSSNFYEEYLTSVEILGKRFKLNEKDVVLAFDYTDENFYGNVQGFWIHGWKGENAIVGKFKFLTCAIVSSDIPQKILLISVPIHLGHNMAKEVCFCFSRVQPLVRSIKLSLFDRGFYSKELILALSDKYPYLIFVPKNEQVKKELDKMIDREKKKIHYEFKLNKHKTVLRGETTLALLKQIMDPSKEKKFDWAFATNQDEINLEYIIPTYKGRWRIETGFRVQDEARIKSKSKDMRIRFFYFVYEQMLQLLWVVLYKEELSFKAFVIEMYEMSNKKVARAERKFAMANG
uniref:Transposase IS4-like domain-containing protein n=1 Tax=Candidatus Methanogaster sp. ANME-2c ERB4 TaxID=2759911 RepID=A0A7G9Y8R1_9EURY|nr:hypothetical protein NONIOKLP_00002 [Methanosarcinales archaeon ANME-2c ERB4]QNO44829.1 hypothetical protein AKKIKKOJ_00002 [Methanosarcinales archaeon ANME-2c ERB4]QNO46578.1 hypothetical protein DOHMCPNA_00002 [Methanosarcinales archaeon ANME-2c ERB4]